MQPGTCPAAESLCKNEPQPTQVVGGLDGNNAIPGALAMMSTVPAEYEPDGFEKVVAVSFKELAPRRDYDRPA